MFQSDKQETPDSIEKVKSIFDYNDIEFKKKDEKKIDFKIEPFSPYFRLGQWWKFIFRW